MYFLVLVDRVFVSWLAILKIREWFIEKLLAKVSSSIREEDYFMNLRNSRCLDLAEVVGSVVSCRSVSLEVDGCDVSVCGNLDTFFLRWNITFYRYFLDVMFHWNFSIKLNDCTNLNQFFELFGGRIVQRNTSNRAF